MVDDMMIRRRKTEDGGQRSCAAASRLFVRVTVFCLLSSVFCPLNAEELPDPTRPPAAIIALLGTASGTASGAAHGQLASQSQPSGLQSTIISGSRRAAIIDGKTVELGGKHGNAQLVEVSEGSVVLRNGQKIRVLTLFPDVKMTQKEIKTSKKPPGNGAQPEETSTMPAAQ